MRGHDINCVKLYVKDKQRALEATVEYALRRDDLKDGFKEYLKNLI